MAFLGGAAQVVPVYNQTIGNTATNVTYPIASKQPDFVLPVVHQATAAYVTIVNLAASGTAFSAIANTGGTVCDFWCFYNEA